MSVKDDSEQDNGQNNDLDADACPDDAGREVADAQEDSVANSATDESAAPDGKGCQADENTKAALEAALAEAEKLRDGEVRVVRAHRAADLHLRPHPSEMHLRAVLLTFFVKVGVHTSGQYYQSRRFDISILFPYLSTHNFYCSGICDPILYCSPVSVSSCTVSKLRTRNTQLPATYRQWYTRFGTGAT